MDDKKVFCINCDHFIGGRIFSECNYGKISPITGYRESTWANQKNHNMDCKDFTPRRRGIIAWIERNIIGHE